MRRPLRRAVHVSWPWLETRRIAAKCTQAAPAMRAAPHHEAEGGCAAPGTRSSELLRRHLLALEVAEAGTIGLLVQELLHALAAAVLLVHVLQGVALGVEIICRLRLVHEAHRADRLLGVAHRGRALLHQLLGELDGLLSQLLLRV